jgi:hypothetical protein
METVKELMHGMASNVLVLINGGASAEEMQKAADRLHAGFHALRKTLPPEVYDLEVTE